MSVTRCIGRTLVLAGTLLAMPAGAVTFVVDDTSDAGDFNPGDGVCETLVPDQCTLRAAFEEANALDGDDRIELPEGVFPGGHVVTGRLEVVGAGRDLTIIDAGGTDRVLTVEGQSALGLESLTLANGASDEGAGGVQCSAQQLTLQDVHVTGCRGEVGGLDVVVTDFVANGLLVTDCTGTDGTGGLRGRAAQGWLTDSTFRGNAGNATFAGGGAELNGFSVERCTFEDNTSSVFGGGLSLYGLTVRVADSVFRGNHAPYGGGVAAMANGHVTFGRFTMLNCTVSGNTAEIAGAGIYHEFIAATIEHSTITENTVLGGGGAGGGIGSRGVNYRGPKLGHTIVAGNDATLGADCYAELGAIGPNLLLDDSDCDVHLQGNDWMIGVDPLLGPLEDNGGPTLTHALLHDSPAIDAAEPGDCIDDRGVPVATDQTGFLRPSGLACDLGAYEYDVTNDMDDDGAPDVTDNCAEVANDQLDSDGDGWGDACDCAVNDAGSFAVPGEITLSVARTPEVQLAWSDASDGAGQGVVYDLAMGSIASLHERGAADADCFWTGTHWLATEAPEGDDTYYLVRAVNACGPGPGEGWGSDSLGWARPACP